MIYALVGLALLIVPIDNPIKLGLVLALIEPQLVVWYLLTLWAFKY